MRIAFFVNDIEREFPGYTTTVLAHQAAMRGHEVCYVTPSDFVLTPDDCLHVHGRFLPKTKWKDREEMFAGLKKVGSKTRQLDMAEIDVLMLRNDPSLDAQTAAWAAEAGILFGREAVKRGVIVLNDPDSLGKAINKLYFQSFPSEARAETLITRHTDDIKAFAKAHGGEIILKPLQGSGGSGVFKLDAKTADNMNQMIEAIGRDGYIIAQGRSRSIDGSLRSISTSASVMSIRSTEQALSSFSASKNSARVLNFFFGRKRAWTLRLSSVRSTKSDGVT